MATMKAVEADGVENPRKREKLLSHRLIKKTTLETVTTHHVNANFVGSLELKFCHICVLHPGDTHSHSNRCHFLFNTKLRILCLKDDGLWFNSSEDPWCVKILTVMQRSQKTIFN